MWGVFCLSQYTETGTLIPYLISRYMMNEYWMIGYNFFMLFSWSLFKSKIMLHHINEVPNDVWEGFASSLA